MCHRWDDTAASSGQSGIKSKTQRRPGANIEPRLRNRSRLEREVKMRRELRLWAAILCLGSAAAMPVRAEDTPKYGGKLPKLNPENSPPSLDAHGEENHATNHPPAPLFTLPVPGNPL